MFPRAYLVVGMVIFENRQDAGEKLATLLITGKTPKPHLVIGLARGGVTVAHVISRKLAIPFRVLVVKKIGSPGDPELAIGAQAPDGVTDIDWDLAVRTGGDEQYVRDKIRELKREIRLMQELYRLPGKPESVSGKTIVLTDDGIATGASARAAIKWLRLKGASRIILAVPVMPEREVAGFEKLADELIFLAAPGEFVSVGAFYRDFSQVETNQVLQLLRGGKE